MVGGRVGGKRKIDGGGGGRGEREDEIGSERSRKSERLRGLE